MNTHQPGLFPEPERTEQPPTEHRWHVLDDQDGPAFTQTHAARVLGTYPTLDAVRADYADDSEWLYDCLTDQVYEPYTWPNTDQPRAISLHLRALAGVDA